MVPYSGGYAMLPPTQSHHGHPIEHTHNPLHHDFQRRFHGMPQMDPHISVPYNKFYPSDYGNYFTAQPMEPFNDHSFAFCPPPPPPQPQFPISPRNMPANGFHYPSPPQYFYPPQILLASPPLPHHPAQDAEIDHQFGVTNQVFRLI